MKSSRASRGTVVGCLFVLFALNLASLSGILSRVVGSEASAAAPPSKLSEQPLEPGASAFVDLEAGEVVGIKQGNSDASCRVVLIFDHSDGTPVLTDIRCDFLPACKPRNCEKRSKPTNLPGITEVWCECE